MPEKNEQKNELMTQTATIESTLVSSKDGTHRYLLTRRWDRLLPKLLVVMIRPGYSGLVTEDTSTSLVLGQAVELGFGSVAVANIFSRLGMEEQDLANEDSTDKENDTQILKAAESADKIVIATGRKNSAVIEKRRAEVLEILRPHAAKLQEIADSDGRSGFHPLSPRIRFHWTLVPLSLGTQKTAKAEIRQNWKHNPKRSREPKRSAPQKRPSFFGSYSVPVPVFPSNSETGAMGAKGADGSDKKLCTGADADFGVVRLVV